MRIHIDDVVSLTPSSTRVAEPWPASKTKNYRLTALCWLPAFTTKVLRPLILRLSGLAAWANACPELAAAPSIVERDPRRFLWSSSPKARAKWD